MMIVEPIYAYRAWALCDPASKIGAKSYLAPITRNIERYKPRETMEATCKCPLGTIPIIQPLPHTNGTCGIYAFKDIMCAINFVIAIRQIYSKGRYVFGKVALWGNIEEHKDGYRAQYAYPTGFFDLYKDYKTILTLADAWAVDVLGWPVMQKYKTYNGYILEARPATDEEFKAHLAIPHRFSCSLDLEDAWLYVKADGLTCVDHSPATLGYLPLDKDNKLLIE